MKFFLITDDADTCVGMRLAGINSVLVHDAQKAEKALDDAVSDKDIGMILITAKVKSFCSEKVRKIAAGNRPIIVEIPDSSNSASSSGAISDYIRSTIGISV